MTGLTGSFFLNHCGCSPWENFQRWFHETPVQLLDDLHVRELRDVPFSWTLSPVLPFWDFTNNFSTPPSNHFNAPSFLLTRCVPLWVCISYFWWLSALHAFRRYNKIINTPRRGAALQRIIVCGCEVSGCRGVQDTFVHRLAAAFQRDDFFFTTFFLSFLSLPLQLPIAQQIFWLIHNSLSPHVFTPGWSLISRLSLQHTQILPPGCLPSSFLFLGRRWDFQGIFHPPHNFSPSGKSMSTRERILDKKKHFTQQILFMGCLLYEFSTILLAAIFLNAPRTDNQHLVHNHATDCREKSGLFYREIPLENRIESSWFFDIWYGMCGIRGMRTK